MWDSADPGSGALLYSACAATNEAPHAETPGVLIRAYEQIGIGFVNKGAVAVSDPQDWPTWDPHWADAVLEHMGWTRIDSWVPRSGIWFASVVRGLLGGDRTEA